MPGWEEQKELCACCALGNQGLLFEQDSGRREWKREFPQTRERLTGALVRVRWSHAETLAEEEGGDR
jgi:hypothetical protein